MSQPRIGLREIPTHQLKKFLGHLHRAEVACPLTIVGLTCIGFQYPSESFLHHLRGMDKAAVTAVVVAVLAERIAHAEEIARMEDRIRRLEDAAEA